MRNQLRDPALRWLYIKMKAQQEDMPEEDRIGFDAWLRENGIVSQKMLQSIALFETDSLDKHPALEDYE